MKPQLGVGFENLRDSRILITGASGWLGHESLCLLNKSFAHLQELKLTLVGSSKKFISIHNSDLRITPFLELPLENNYDLILHFAFATQDKMKTLGEAKYIESNFRLNEWISIINAENPEAKKLILSSGAVSKFSIMDVAPTSMRIYSDLKKNLEDRFQDPNSLILRLWSTSGHHMGADSKYALGEFVSKAIKGENIIVGKNLKRTYVAASSVLQSSILYLLDGGSGIVNSGGFEINLLDLAKLTLGVLNSKSECILENSAQFPELDYISPATEIPQNYWLENLSLSKQILTVASGV